MLTPDTDALGKAVLDFIGGNLSQDIIVHSNVADDDVLPVRLLFRQEFSMSDLEKTALKNCRGRVLDIGAGAGCHSLALEEKGFDVTAIDISPGAVEGMKLQGLKQVQQLAFFDARGQHFDTLLLMMNGIGLSGTLDGFDEFLQHAKTLLAPGGQIIFDTSDIEYLYMDDDGSKWVNLNGAYYGEVEYQMEYQGTLTPKFNWLYLDYITLTDHCLDNGFELELLFDDERFNYLVRLTAADNN